MTDANYPDFDQRVKDALAQVKAPEAAKAEALAAIEALRSAAEGESAGTPWTASGSQSSSEGVGPFPSANVPQSLDGQRRDARVSTFAGTAFANAPQRRRRRWIAPLAAAACLLLVGVLAFAGWRVWQEPAAFVSVDVNPSIELTVNAFDHVVAAKGVNEDGSAVLTQVNVCGKTYEEALATLMGSSAMAPYVAEDAFVDVNVTCTNNDTAAALEAQSTAVMRQYPCQSVCQRADEATREAALAAGMGVGRYQVASELAELDESVELDDCADMTMRQLEDAVGELCHDESHNHGTGHGHGSGNGGGNGAGGGNGSGSGAGSGNGAGAGSGSGAGAGAGSGSGSGSQHGQGHGNGHGQETHHGGRE